MRASTQWIDVWFESESRWVTSVTTILQWADLSNETISHTLDAANANESWRRKLDVSNPMVASGISILNIVLLCIIDNTL